MLKLFFPRPFPFDFFRDLLSEDFRDDTDATDAPVVLGEFAIRGVRPERADFHVDLEDVFEAAEDREEVLFFRPSGFLIFLEEDERAMEEDLPRDEERVFRTFSCFGFSSMY